MSANLQPAWIKQYGTSSFETSAGAALADDGRIWTVTSGRYLLDGQSKTNDADNNIIIFNPDGTVHKTISAGAINSQIISGITGNSGKIYVAGQTTAGSLDGQPNNWGKTGYLTSYDNSGTKLWTRLLPGYTGTRSVTSDNSGIYVAGFTYGGLNGKGGYGGADAFIAKYDQTGKLLWTDVIGGNGDNANGGINQISANNAYVAVAGYTNQSIDGQSQGSGGFITFYSTNGTKLWSRMRTDGIGAIYVSPDKTLYISGGKAGTTDFYISKLDTSGNQVWTNVYGTSGTDSAVQLSCDSSGRLIVLGSTTGAIAGSANAGKNDNIIYTIDPSNGSVLDSKQWGSNASDIGTQFALSNDGTLYIAGSTNEALPGNTLAGGTYDPYLIKYNLPSANPSVPIVRGNSLYTIVDGPSWSQAEANSVKLGGHLATINDANENKWIIDYYKQTGNSLSPDSRGVRNIFIGLTRNGGTGTKYQNSAGKLDGWISGESPSYRPEYWGTGEGMDPDGYFSALVWGEGTWNDFPEWQHQGVGLAETPFIRRGDSAYVIVQGPTWEEAEANAVKLGGHLVTINDAAENEWIVDQWRFTNLSPDNISRAWIGYKEGTWVDGTTLNETIQRWSYNFSGGNNRFGQIDLNGPLAGQWADLENNHGAMKHGIAEIKLAPNNTPTGTANLTGTTKVGQVLTIDRSPIQDADNFTGYTPTFNYSFEVSNDNGTTWTKLTSTDATDNNTTYTLTTAELGKKVRGVVSYLDGYGTNEVVPTVGSASVTDPSPTYTLTPSATSVNEGSTISYTLTTSNVASGTSLYYQFSGTGVNAADFSSATTTGSESVGSNGQMTISRTFTADKITEGNESLILKVFTDSAATTPLATNSAVSVIDTSLTPSTPTQKVYTDKSEISYKPTGVAALPLLYTTSNNDANLSGLTLNVHYNSSILTPSGANNGVSGQAPAAITTTTILPDTNNTDGDPLTDKIVQLLWATFDNSFPNKTLPAPLAAVSFNTSSMKNDPLTGLPLTTTVRYTASEKASGYDFLTGSTTFKAQQFNLDVDGDGKVTALGDGLMVIRKLFGPAFAGDALTYKAISPEATRTTSEIHDFIQQGIDAGLLDVDKDKKTTALGDGLMVIRRLFGPAFDGAALTNKAISPDSPFFGQSTDFTSVALNIDSLMPNVI